MKIKIEFEWQAGPSECYYRTCTYVHRWTGSVKEAPDWLTDLIADKEAIVVPGKGIFFITANGSPHADIGDIIVVDGKRIDVIRGFKYG